MELHALLVLTAAAAAFAFNDRSPTHAPVLVELFTSEGCSSCPPADALLEELDREEGVIVLSEHVDYWNRQGWRDPFSSALFSERQSRYADRLHLDSVYTPQMIVDGASQFVGSDRAEASRRTASAARQAKVQMRIIPAGPGRFRIEADAATAPAADVFLALAQNEAASSVSRGENAGRRLHHVAVVGSIATIGETRPGQPFAKELPLPGNAAGLRLIAWVQERGQGRVLGASLLRPSR